MNLEELRKIDEPISLEGVAGKTFNGINLNHNFVSIPITQGGKQLEVDSDIFGDFLLLPNESLILPGNLNMHVHGRDCYDIYPGDEGSQLHKEDSFTLSLALAQGGAIYGQCQPNLGNDVCDGEQYERQLKWINSAQSFRPQPIMDLGQYVLIKKGTRPIPGLEGRVMYKLMWNTFGPANLDSDDEVEDVLQHYGQQSPDQPLNWITVHCETIADIVADASLPWHEQRPREGCINATRKILELAKKYHFHAHIAHVPTPEEVERIKEYNQKNNKYGLYATCEVTPQSLFLNHEEFENITGLPIKWSQQNPALGTQASMQGLQGHAAQGNIDWYAGDHAPHIKEEKEAGMSGMPQASTEGQVGLELVTRKVITLADYVRMRCTNPGKVVEKYLGLKMGRIEVGYDASFTLVSMDQPSQITDEFVLSKCGWTPYTNITFSNTIEGVIVKGKLYTQAALQKIGK